MAETFWSREAIAFVCYILQVLAVAAPTVAATTDLKVPPQTDSKVLSHPSLEKGRMRIEELYKWKVSDTLELSNEEEARFSEILKEIGERRRLAVEEEERLIVKIKATDKTEDLEQLIRQYQKQAQVLTETHKLECEKLKKLFGVKRFANYIVLKSELNHKLKDYLSHGGEKSRSVRKEETSQGVLPDPKVIESE